MAVKRGGKFMVFGVASNEARISLSPFRIYNDEITIVARGTSGLHRAGWWLTATRGNPRDSATESKPPGASALGKGETVV